MRPRLFLVLLPLVLWLGACNQTAAIDQDNLCSVKEWQLDATKAACKPGQKVTYLPERFGNEQLPILFAAVNCDLRYSVALTNGGVSCIYAPMTPVKK